ncbi:MAG: hypothetical protein A3B13_00700 [Candidatus Liptonbacteria bacterium RIFCSPLOWO2_01_FULL_45_15]|uniref:Uncharacterized protein n=1 Tax=Candidatus Liptonbacteria bacterium RIFCSPLOWO2_01_FULL_45_15 TaxID=1798649 RepID=A0A1G2CCJ3_9BACT|nr:MAG: hypothetical protein A3B13_00700 [Candidatus Liptonbacteria bacterium RIFCSPLOWO2_01_FULL_45_15]
MILEYNRIIVEYSVLIRLRSIHHSGEKRVRGLFGHDPSVCDGLKLFSRPGNAFSLGSRAFSCVFSFLDYMFVTFQRVYHKKRFNQIPDGNSFQQIIHIMNLLPALYCFLLCSLMELHPVRQ